MKPVIQKTLFRIYDLAWGAFMPWLGRNQRLAEGLGQRMLQEDIPGKADLWIQAASAGEAYLAWSLLENLRPFSLTRVLATSNTSQGMGILDRAIADIHQKNKGLKIASAYFPFDRPAIMDEAVQKIRPKVMVLLELEIWPGLLAALKKYRCKTLIINGRITPGSLKRYMVWPSLWRAIRPDRILAISENDAARFAELFGKDGVEVMRNIKFDRIGPRKSHKENLLQKIIGSDSSLIVLGSTRQEEEPLIEQIISRIRERMPGAVIALFPRHIHRVSYWRSALARLAVPWSLRSEIQRPVSDGTIILWDTFGELSLAYELAQAAYVGGSLARLGGQNFLEPLISGVIPVIGPSWENFAWVGQEIADKGLLRIGTDWQDVTKMLIQNIAHPQPREAVRKAALGYVKARQGGTAKACALINQFLNRG